MPRRTLTASTVVANRLPKFSAGLVGVAAVIACVGYAALTLAQGRTEPTASDDFGVALVEHGGGDPGLVPIAPAPERTTPRVTLDIESPDDRRVVTAFLELPDGACESAVPALQTVGGHRPATPSAGAWLTGGIEPAGPEPAAADASFRR